MGLSISLLFLLLYKLVHDDESFYDPATFLDDGVPVWRYFSLGYLKGFSWTLLGLDLRFGRMTFNQAKTLHLVWNWVAGRGLQAFLAWLTYPVHTAALMRIAEAASVSYGLFTSLAIFSTSPASLCALVRALLRIPGVRAKLILLWLICSTTYLAAVPSLLDVMSGYETSIRTELNLPNSTTLDTTDLDNFGSLYYSLPVGEPTCQFFPYAKGARGIAFYDSTLDTSYYDGDSGGLEFQSHAYFSYSGFYIAVQEHYSCGAEKDIYQWGFSGEWIIMVSALNSVWVFELWILWLDAEWKSQFTRKGRRMGTYRAIADIADAMKGDLGENFCAYLQKELAAALKRRGPIKYYVGRGAKGEVGHIGLSSRYSERANLEWDKEYG